MLLRALLTVLAVAALASGCSGDGGDADGATLLPSSFDEVVVAKLKEAGLDAEPAAGDLEVRAQQGANWVDLDLEDEFARYGDDPGSREEILDGVVQDAKRRLDEGISGTSLADVRADLLPLLKGPFELRTYGFEPARTPFPAGLSVVYAVDTGDSFTVVQPDDVERWGTTVAEVDQVARDNLLNSTNKEQPLLCEPSGKQELCGWASGDGYDATRMIVPELRAQIERQYGGPAVYAVPMENVFVALPRKIVDRGLTEKALRLKVRGQFQTSDDPLSPALFVERDGELVTY